MENRRGLNDLSLRLRPLHALLLVVVLTACACSPTQVPTVEVTRSTDVPPTSLTQSPEIVRLEPEYDQPFDEFLEVSHRMLLAHDPELVTKLGLTSEIGTPNYVLTDISDTYIRETQQLEAAILNALRAYDRETLTQAQKLSYDIYMWFLEDRVLSHEFMYYDYPVSHFLTGVQNQLVLFFTDLHPVRNQQEAEDYIARLWLVDDKFEQLVEGLQLRQDAGVVLPKFIIQWTMNDINRLAGRTAVLTPFYTALEEKLTALDSMDYIEKEGLLAEAEAAIVGSVLPAYHELNDFLETQLSIATDEVGAWQLPDGDAYYEYALRHHTTTELPPDEVHDLGLRELARIHPEMRERFERLGYPRGESLTASYARVTEAGGRLPGVEVVAAYEALIQEMETHLEEAFDLRPGAEVVVIGGTTGGYYVAPALDGSRPGAFYASVSAVQSRFGMPTLTYHEAIPGHHMQIAIAQELDLPSFRRGPPFTAYVEGWALYAERLAWEMGLYDDDPYGDLGRLQAEAFRAARLVVDTGLHSRAWDFDQAVEFMVENTGLSSRSVNWEVSRYVVWPGQAAAYMTGMLEILTLREMVREARGDQFDLAGFHNVILGEGSMPLGILETQVENIIATSLNP